jgi:glutathione S-transferase
MITVHHLENSRSQRVLWLLEELGLDYEIKRYERNKTTSLAPPELKAVHPLGKSPVITDDGLVVAETGAIIEYIIDKYAAGRLVPPAGSTERRRYTYWMHMAEGTAMPLLVMTESKPARRGSSARSPRRSPARCAQPTSART